MAEIVKITKGQPFVLYVPLVILNADGTKESVDASSLTNISVTYQGACSDKKSIAPEAYERFLVLKFDGDLQVAEYSMHVTATLSSDRQFSLRFKRAFAIVEWDYQSNWRDYLIGDHIELNDQAFIAGYAFSDAELIALKEQLRQAIADERAAEAAAQAAKAAFDAKAEALDGIALEETSQQILTKVSNAAQQGNDPTATNTAIKQLIINEGIERANEYAAEIRNIIGDWNNE